MEKANVLFGFLFLWIIVSCQPVKNDNKAKEEKRIEKIRIKAADLGILTFISIDCDEFERTHFYDIDYSTTDTSEINDFLSQIAQLEPFDSIEWDVDTRAKIFLYSQNDTNTICASAPILTYNGWTYDMPEWLYDYIESLVDDYHKDKTKDSQ